MFYIEGNESNEKWAHEIMADVFETYKRANEEISKLVSEPERRALKWFETAISWVCNQGAGYIIENRANLETYALFQNFIEKNKTSVQLDHFDFKFAYGRFTNRYERVS